MPIYEYECSKGHQFELMESFTAPRTRKCPKCGKTAKRLISLASFHLQGSGWYCKDSKSSSHKDKKKTDEKKGEKKHEEKKTAESKPAESKPAEKKTESKPKKHA